jgi:hypothetical protein
MMANGIIVQQLAKPQVHTGAVISLHRKSFSADASSSTLAIRRLDCTSKQQQ